MKNILAALLVLLLAAPVYGMGVPVAQFSNGAAYVESFMNGTLPPDVTFLRSGNGWYFNSSGTLTSAGTNVPRFDYDPATLKLKGLLIEQAATNLFLNSQSPATQNV